MDKEDSRKLKPEQQRERRKIALGMRMNGREFAKIGEAEGGRPRTIQCWRSPYQAEGLKSAEGGKRGRGGGEWRTLPGSRFSSNIISTITNQRKVRFMLYREMMTASVLIRFLARLVGDWLKIYAEHIEVFFLLAYSTELNPDEYLNCDEGLGSWRENLPRTRMS